MGTLIMWGRVTHAVGGKQGKVHTRVLAEIWANMAYKGHLQEVKESVLNNRLCLCEH